MFKLEHSQCYKCGSYGATHATTSDNPIRGHLCDDCFEKRLKFTSSMFRRRLAGYIPIPVYKQL